MRTLLVIAPQPGLAEAAQQVGGFSKGVFGYDNQRESAQTTWETLRTGSGIDRLLKGAVLRKVVHSRIPQSDSEIGEAA